MTVCYIVLFFCSSGWYSVWVSGSSHTSHPLCQRSLSIWDISKEEKVQCTCPGRCDLPYVHTEFICFSCFSFKKMLLSWLIWEHLFYFQMSCHPELNQYIQDTLHCVKPLIEKVGLTEKPWRCQKKWLNHHQSNGYFVYFDIKLTSVVWSIL